ncbi:hypothetical protein C1646_715175 [Rhizophagus diaphanus]|nr:hypothetical protein C1646_715175 [Rhizophagus diaphanus] [Rhizophagus sp. MUCL 43196]
MSILRICSELVPFEISNYNNQIRIICYNKEKIFIFQNLNNLSEFISNLGRIFLKRNRRIF